MPGNFCTICPQSQVPEKIYRFICFSIGTTRFSGKWYGTFPFSLSKYRTCSTICRNILTENFIQMVSAPDNVYDPIQLRAPCFSFNWNKRKYPHTIWVKFLEPADYTKVWFYQASWERSNFHPENIKWLTPWALALHQSEIEGLMLEMSCSHIVFLRKVQMLAWEDRLYLFSIFAFPIIHFVCPAKCCINHCFQMPLGTLHILMSIWKQALLNTGTERNIPE